MEGELAGLKAQLDALEKEGVEGGRRGAEEEGDEVLYVFHSLFLGVCCICWECDLLTLFACLLGLNCRFIARLESTCRRTPRRGFSTVRLSGIRRREMSMLSMWMASLTRASMPICSGTAFEEEA